MTTELPPTMYPRLTRSVPVTDVVLADGVLEALFVPFDAPITVYGEEPEPYREAFHRTAFDDQLNRYPETIRSVVLMPRHGSSETFGHTTTLTPTDAGLHGLVSVLPSRRDDVRAMVDDGIDSVSIEFHPLQRQPRVRNGVRWRDRVFLTGIVLTSTPAYPGAKVLAMRAEESAARAEAEARRHWDALGDELAEMRAAGERWNSLQVE